ncbi:hypothetical protein EI613_24780 [Azospirillum sp. 412522]|nr:hypothetical protein [Azospirillum sp. 412522]MBY6265110.1 hypothetical protein [Azospirillum sp. 412522]
MGGALLIGRAECLSEKTGKLNTKRFGAWCVEKGFGPIDAPTRSNAMWLAEEWERVTAALGDTQGTNANNPTEVRKAYRKAVEAAIAAALDEETAKKALKFHRMVEADSAAQAETDMAERWGVVSLCDNRCHSS